MPNIKSAIKRVNVIEKKTLRNNMIKSVKQLEKGDNITLTLADGKVPAIVK